MPSLQGQITSRGAKKKLITGPLWREHAAINM